MWNKIQSYKKGLWRTNGQTYRKHFDGHQRFSGYGWEKNPSPVCWKMGSDKGRPDDRPFLHGGCGGPPQSCPQECFLLWVIFSFPASKYIYTQSANIKFSLKFWKKVKIKQNEISWNSVNHALKHQRTANDFNPPLPPNLYLFCISLENQLLVETIKTIILH